MLRPRYTIFIFLTLVAMVSCTTGKDQPEAEKATLDDFDTLYVGKGSMLSIDRYRIYLNKNVMLRLGKMNMKFTIDDLKTGVHAQYPIDSGVLVYNKEFFTAQCFIGTEQIKLPVIDSAQHLEMETPAYLMNGGKKYIVVEYKGNFYPKERTPSASCSLTLNDSTGLLNNADSKVEIKNKKISSIQTQAYVDGLKWKLYEPVNGQEIKKDSLQLKFNIRFSQK